MSSSDLVRPQRDEVGVRKRRNESRGPFRSKVPDQAGKAPNDSPGLQVDNTNLRRHVLQAGAFSLRKYEIDTESLIGQPPCDVQHDVLGPARGEVGQEQRDMRRRVRRNNLTVCRFCQGLGTRQPTRLPLA